MFHVAIDANDFKDVFSGVERMVDRHGESFNLQHAVDDCFESRTKFEWTGVFHQQSGNIDVFLSLCHIHMSSMGNSISGDMNMMVVTFVDLTKEKETERKSLELLKRAHESQKLQSLGRFSGGIAHNFNNLLSIISGCAEILKTTMDEKHMIGPECMQELEDIQSTCDRGVNTVRRLLSVSQPQGAAERVVREVIDVPSLVSNVISELRSIVVEKTVSACISLKKTKVFKRRVAEKQCVLRGDSSALEHALQNMGINAIHAMNKESVGSLTFKLDAVKSIPAAVRFQHSSATDSDCLFFIKLSVIDDGCGIRDEHKDLIFDPFFSTKPSEKGTGLGLPEVLTTVNKLFNGALDVVSVVGEGSKFIIYLPCSPSHIESGKEEMAHQLIQTDKKSAKKILKILLVDDEDIIIRIGSTVLKRSGHEVITAKNGKEAVDLFASHGSFIDLVVMDMHMPVMNGKEAFLLMKEINPDVKVIIASGLVDGIDVQETLSFGALDALPKPYNAKDLLKMINNAFLMFPTREHPNQ
jgi:signal transduction histidine kinase/ActR/RegA family two-component response regulator